MIKALIFDMDGTVVESERLHYHAWNEVLINYGVSSMTYAEFTRYVGASNEKLADDYIRTFALRQTVAQLVAEKQAIYLEMIPAARLLPGVREMIEGHHKKYRLAIASSSDCVELELILKTFGMRACFEQVVGGDMVRQKKPHSEIYFKTMELLGLEPLECVAFEDSESGLNAAKNAGMFSVAIPNSLSQHHDFSSADLVVNRIDHVTDNALQKLASASS